MFKKSLVIFTVLLVVVLMSGCDKRKPPEVKQEIKTEEANQEELTLPDINQDDWQTYTDEAWGFSIKFPKELYHRVHPQGEKYPGEECLTCGNGGQLLIISDQEEMGIQDIMLDENVHIELRTFKLFSTFKNEISWEENLKNREDVFKSKFNGMEVFMIKSEEGSIPLFFVKDDWVYSISAADIKQDEFEKTNDLMKKIKLTFKFIK